MKNSVCPPGSLSRTIYFKRLKSPLCCLTDHQAAQRRPVGALQPIKDQQHAEKGKYVQGTAKKVARRIIPGARNKRSMSPVLNLRLTLKTVQGDRLMVFLLLVWIFYCRFCTGIYVRQLAKRLGH